MTVNFQVCGICQVCILEGHLKIMAKITNHLFSFRYKRRVLETKKVLKEKNSMYLFDMMIICDLWRIRWKKHVLIIACGSQWEYLVYWFRLNPVAFERTWWLNATIVFFVKKNKKVLFMESLPRLGD